MKHLLKLAACAAIILAVSACVYPFEPEIRGEDGRLVVEGDIHIGNVSTFNFSRVYPLDLESTTYSPIMVNGYIEGEDGTHVESVSAPASDYMSYYYGISTVTFDTTTLPTDQKYRLHFQDTQSGTVYESDWIEVNPAPVIDDLSYILDGDRGELNVALSMHCNGRSHFRWHYYEEWEYHARRWTNYYYDPKEKKIKEYEDGANTYYCWNTYNSPSIKIFSTADQVEDRFVDLEFHRIGRNDNRLQILYHIKVYLEALDEEAYRYWQNIKQNSQNQGTIFSPTPSQMTGNIHCVTDPSVMVIGYVGAAVQAEADMFYDDMAERFYRDPYKDEIEVKELDPSEFQLYYDSGYNVLEVIEDIGAPTIYQWVKVSCVDCRKAGGTKNKPAGWPNNHK